VIFPLHLSFSLLKQGGFPLYLNALKENEKGFYFAPPVDKRLGQGFRFQPEWVPVFLFPIPCGSCQLENFGLE